MTTMAAFARQSVRAPWLVWVLMAGGLAALVLASFGLGRYGVPFGRVLGILGSTFGDVPQFWDDTEQAVVLAIRVPRVLVACVAGAGLAIAGAALQGTFRNPLVGPQIIGVSSGAAFGGAIALLLFPGKLALVGLCFVFGLLAIAIVLAMSRVGGRTPILMLVLAGVVTSAFFTALVSLIKYIADPEDTLPTIVFWLMGSFSTAGYDELVWLAVPTVMAGAVLYLLRWRINVLSLGDEEAEALGIRVERTRLAIILCVAAIAASVVAVAGVVGWVGLVVPHVARMMVGPDHRVLLPASALTGAGYLLLIDDMARTATAAEIPLGVITAIIGAPIFAYLLKRTQGRGWRRD